jgi:hypothetical protein
MTRPNDREASIEQTAASSGRTNGPSLGQALKIRSMVTVAGEFLPFMWPMRNFIHHNPLNGLEHLPFEEAVEQAARLFHARGYLHRTDYQAFMHEGHIAQDVIDDLVSELLRESSPVQATTDAETGELHRILVTLMTGMDHLDVGNADPGTDAILAQLHSADTR